MADSKRASRRRHSEELKRRVLAACAEPDASVAKIALEHGLNANLVHKWRRLAARPRCEAAPAREFVALALPSASPPSPAADLRIELRRGALAVSVSWPLSAHGECAAWLRELLR